MSPQLKRREFITLVGGAMAAWPLAARAQQSAMPVIRFLSQGSASSTAAETEAFRAQQPERMRRIGVLMNVAADDSEAPARIGAFSQGLAELGWTIGRNVRIDYRWYAGNADAARKYAAELIALAPDIVLASGTLGVTATINRRADRVHARRHPVGAGFVNSLASRAATPLASCSTNTA